MTVPVVELKLPEAEEGVKLPRLEKPKDWWLLGSRQLAVIVPAVYSMAVTETQYTTRPTSRAKGSRGKSRMEGMAPTAWLATCNRRRQHCFKSGMK